jgi:hypothetical protein
MASLGGVGLRRNARVFCLRRWRRVPSRRMWPAALVSARGSFIVTIRRVPRLSDLHAVLGAMFCCFFQFQGSNS